MCCNLVAKMPIWFHLLSNQTKVLSFCLTETNWGGFLMVPYVCKNFETFLRDVVFRIFWTCSKLLQNRRAKLQQEGKLTTLVLEQFGNSSLTVRYTILIPATVVFVCCYYYCCFFFFFFILFPVQSLHLPLGFW